VIYHQSLCEDDAALPHVARHVPLRETAQKNVQNRTFCGARFFVENWLVVRGGSRHSSAVGFSSVS
jgi:hypothetical protein